MRAQTTKMKPLEKNATRKTTIITTNSIYYIFRIEYYNLNLLFFLFLNNRNNKKNNKK